MTAVRDIFLAAIFVWQRKQVRLKGLSAARNNIGTGAVVFSQRFGDYLNVNPHFHAILPDGVFIKPDECDKVVFVQIPSPKDADIQSIATRLVKRIRRLLEKRGLLKERDFEQPLDGLDKLVQLTLCSVGTGSHQPNQHHARLSAFIDGFSLQAGTHIHRNDRAGLEHLCRYGLRPPIALSRLKQLGNGNYEYSLKYPLASGEYQLVLTGQELLKRLALLVPRPYVHLVRYHGVFAPRARWRPWIVPKAPSEKCKSSPIPVMTRVTA